MTNSLPRLVLRRTESEDENKIAIRLSPDVDRTADLYELFSAGIVIEVIDIAPESDSGNPEVTLALRAPTEFLVDRSGRIRHPRRSDAIGAEESLTVRMASEAEIRGFSNEELDSELASAKGTANKLRAQLVRLKRDRSKASERGYQKSNDNRHHEWLMLIEEMDIVTEQMRSAEAYVSQLNNIHKSRHHALMSDRREAFENHFIRLVKKKLKPKDFEKLRNEAQRLADAAVCDPV